MTSLLDPPAADGAFSIGPADAGELPFILLGQQFAAEVPEDGRQACGWAREGAWTHLIPWGLAPWAREPFARLLTDPIGPVDLTVCHQIAMELAPDIYGVPWWTAGRVAQALTDQWDKWAAWCVTRAFDPVGEPAHRIIASGLGWLRSGVGEEKDAKKLEAALFAPPVEVRRARRGRPTLRPEDQAASWRAAKAAWGTG